MPKGKNFTEAEKMLLEELVVQHKYIIENKQTDSFTVLKKKAIWNRITSEFNDKLKNSQKDVTQLKKLWENIKFRRKTERKNLLQTESALHFASTNDKKPYIDSRSSITELTHNVDCGSLLLEPQTSMIVEDTSQQNADFVIDSEKDAIKCSGGSKLNDLKIKKQHCHSESTCSEIKPELDSDDDLQNQIVPSPYSLVEYKNPDVTSDDCAVDMKTEIKEETWWHERISPDKFQPELSLLSQSQMRTREDEESVHASKTTTSKNINEVTLDPASYAWHPIPSRIQPIKVRKYRSKNVARAIAELRQLQESVNKHISQNQFDIFGRSVASQLKAIQHYKALEAQSQIQTLLTNTAIEAFRSSKS